MRENLETWERTSPSLEPFLNFPECCSSPGDSILSAALLSPWAWGMAMGGWRATSVHGSLRSVAGNAASLFFTSLGQSRTHNHTAHISIWLPTNCVFSTPNKHHFVHTPYGDQVPHNRTTEWLRLV